MSGVTTAYITKAVPHRLLNETLMIPPSSGTSNASKAVRTYL
jgi:hypothetical protein